MFARRIKTEQPVDDKAGTVIVQPANVQAARSPDMKAEMLAARKPSEKFMRKCIEVKSRASHSERRRLADLAEHLKKTAENKTELNEMKNLSCYRPGTERPPG